MLPLAGYAERLSARPGETLRFHVANATGASIEARVVRVKCADPNPEIGGVDVEALSIPVTTLAKPGPQIVPSGSRAILGPSGLMKGMRDGRVTLRIQPMLRLSRDQTILSCRDDAGRGLALELTPALTFRGRVGSAAGEVAVETVEPVAIDAWTEVTLAVDADRGVLALTVIPLADAASARTVETGLRGAPEIAADAPLTLASASAEASVNPFNGRLEHPVLVGRGPGGEVVLGDWDFAREMHTQRVVDTGPGANHGELVNTPTRAVRGSTWTGEEHCFRHAPTQYAAIHFHEDDLDDCRWPATHAV
ncbi:MAG: hypothetical protein RIS35_1666, partial [Pseudomonadota bacterium]